MGISVTIAWAGTSANGHELNRMIPVIWIGRQDSQVLFFRLLYSARTFVRIAFYSASRVAESGSWRGLMVLGLRALLVANLAAQAHSPTSPPPPGAKSEICRNRTVPELVDVTEKSGIHFRHLSAPEKKYIVESMSCGVLILDYDRDGWPDIYFTYAPTVDMAL
jgi:hypothetical protein